MQRDVKIGIAIGVLLIALIGIFWWLKHNQSANSDDKGTVATTGGDTVMPGPIFPVDPASGGDQTGVTTTTLPFAPGPIPGQTGITNPPPPTPPAAQKHVVASGETLGDISRKYYGTANKWEIIAKANNIKDETKVPVGRELIIPADVSSSVNVVDNTTPPITPPVAAKTHKVVARDTLTSISQKYYGDTKHITAIYQANKAKMSSPDDLKVDMVLTLP